jgi:hypothetical protein
MENQLDINMFLFFGGTREVKVLKRHSKVDHRNPCENGVMII